MRRRGYQIPPLPPFSAGKVGVRILPPAARPIKVWGSAGPQKGDFWPKMLEIYQISAIFRKKPKFSRIPLFFHFGAQNHLFRPAGPKHTKNQCFLGLLGGHFRKKGGNAQNSIFLRNFSILHHFAFLGSKNAGNQK